MAAPRVQIESAIDALLTLPQTYGLDPKDDRVRIEDFFELHPEFVPVIKEASSIKKGATISQMRR